MFNIRSAIENDARGIAKVHIDSWRAIYRGHMPDSILDNLSFEKREQEWQGRLQDGINAWVIEEDKKIIGFASICPTRDSDADPSRVAEISAIYLLPEFWRKGLGQKLCQVVFDEVAKQGFKEITLWVLENNIQAARFYEAQGFIATGDVEVDHIGCENLRVIRYKKIL
jgi:L-amino acid N-acyltransferase YncA